MKEAARDDGVYMITLCGGQEQKDSFWKDSPVGTLLLNCDMTPDEGESEGGLKGRLGVEDSAESAPQTPYPANAEGRLTGENLLLSARNGVELSTARGTFSKGKGRRKFTPC